VQHHYAAMFQKNESNNMNRLENRTSIRSKSLYNISKIAQVECNQSSL